MIEGSTLGTLVELMVEAEILAGSNGRLAGGDERWDGFEVSRLELADRLQPLVSSLGRATVEELTSLRESAWQS
jgi:hypothetical protein